MGGRPLVVTCPLTGHSRAIVEEALDGAAEAIHLVDLAPAARARALERAGAVLSHDTSKELRPDEIPLIRNARPSAHGTGWPLVIDAFFVRAADDLSVITTDLAPAAATNARTSSAMSVSLRISAPSENQRLSSAASACSAGTMPTASLVAVRSSGP